MDKHDLKLIRIFLKTVGFSALLFLCVAFIPGTGNIAISAESQASERNERDTFILEEITVTASKRDTKLMETPISISAFTPERMDAQGVRSIDDIARLTPGITFNRADGRNPLSNNISIRGVRSTTASSTTGIYLDDTPIQLRVIGAGASGFNAFPVVFDLERVEVLRGPQGTLFGSSSEGGTIRYLTPTPSLTDYSVYARSEVAGKENGGQSYEIGVAVGGPIIEDKLGFRISGFYRRDGGYVDRVNTDPAPGDTPFRTFDLDPSTPPTIFPERRTVNYVVEEDSNFITREVVRGALLYAPTDDLEITGSIYFQEVSSNDTNAYWEFLSDPGDGEYMQGNPMRQPGNDRIYLPALSISWDLGPVRLFSSTSYFDRHQKAINDYAAFESSLWGGYWEFPVGMFAPTLQINDHESWTQEVRIESTNTDSRLQWVAGVFWQRSEQKAIQKVEDRFLPDLVNDSDPFGLYAVLPPFLKPFDAMFFGAPLSEGRYTFNQDPVTSVDKQIAGFLQADLKITDKLTLTAGIRYTEAEFDAKAKYNGAVVGADVNDSGSSKETPVTPKFGLSYNITESTLLYATAAKGFRVGGYNPQIGLPCTDFCVNLGYVPTDDNPTGRPATFDLDTLWSYELGAKHSFLSGRASVSASAYYLDWDDIQQSVVIGNCGFQFTINAGKAEIYGVDLEASMLITDSLKMGMAFGYNHAEYAETVYGGPGATVPTFSKGDSIPGSPWTLTLSGQYDLFVFEKDAYVRLDYEYHAEGPDDVSGLNLANRNPALPPPDPYLLRRSPERQNLNFRAGTQIGNLDISLFVKNVLDSNPNIARTDLAFSPVPFGPDTHGYTGQTVEPRSIGATIVYRF